MKRSHPISERIHYTKAIRGVRDFRELAGMMVDQRQRGNPEELLDLQTERLQRLTSTAEVQPKPAELMAIAQALFVPPAWLAAPDEATATAAAADPAWSWARAVTAPIPTQPPPAPDDADPITRWQRELAICWRDYINRGRADVLDRAVEAMLAKPTATGHPWPTFHRSVAMQAVTDFTPAQQHALGLVLCPKQTPPYADVAAQTRSPALFPCATPMNVLCPPEWPCEPDSGSYGRLLGELERVREGRLIGKPVAGDRFPDLIIDQVVEVMVATFRCRFPDDEELDLLAAVRAYRHFRKRAYVGDDEQDEHRPDRGHEVWELWDNLPAEVILSQDDLERNYTRAGLPTDDLMRHINDLAGEERIRVRRSSGRVWVVVPTSST